ncbi:hypothetical protein F2P81_002122 [Scophthalmus maximus]|uniref:Ig-like domain-containing protein n=1 Tax=Scophthalmus maximus TaxID=52904 RepID=A0A6A4THZ2_SCOMX|nr:hypothetical protein F2P81_002122 [Scophthalmus maximus]
MRVRFYECYYYRYQTLPFAQVNSSQDTWHSSRHCSTWSAVHGSNDSRTVSRRFQGDICIVAASVKVAPKVEVLKGETAKLPCTYTDPSSITLVEWYIEDQGSRKRVAFRSQGGKAESDEGTPLTGRVTIGDDFTLTISSTQPTDELAFYCQVTAGLAGIADATTLLKVFFAPEKPELTRPSSQAISVGETTSSEIGTCVTMNGHPQPRIIWFKDDQPLPEFKDRKEKTFMIPSVVKEASGLYTIKSTLYMQPTKADKDSVFQCTVEYSMPGDMIKEKKSDTITINLNYPSEKATFSLLNADQVKEGDTVKMKCETDGNPQPEIDFTKDGKDITGQGGLLTLKSVKRTDAGEYKCTATDFDNLDADLGGKITLIVHYIDPVNVIPAEPQVAMLGDKVEWQCKTKASAPHTVQWKKGSDVLSQDGTLSIQDVSYDKAGEYMCVGAVPSVPGLTAQSSVNLTVKGKPIIETPAAGEVGKEGDMVSLKCSAYGYPAPQFTWKPSGKESVSVEGNKVVSTVTLQATAEIMKDGVTCEVTNEHGSDSKSFPVSLKRADKQQGGSSGVVIAVVVCVLLLLLMVALIYFLNKKNKLPCSKKGKKEVASGEVNNGIVVEMKTDKANEEAGLLNKRPTTEQGALTLYHFVKALPGTVHLHGPTSHEPIGAAVLTPAPPLRRFSIRKLKKVSHQCVARRYRSVL